MFMFCVFVVYCLFFFFKQKTAYEMRISDWSSDVCSSDLVKFWGVRGSIATPSARHIGFGGNTSCVEVKAGSETIIFDAGTGIRNLGHWLLKRGVRQGSLLLSHTHWEIGRASCRERVCQYV